MPFGVLTEALGAKADKGPPNHRETKLLAPQLQQVIRNDAQSVERDLRWLKVGQSRHPIYESASTVAEIHMVDPNRSG